MAPIQRDQFIKVRATDEEKRMLEKLADDAGITASDWIRLRIREAFQGLPVREEPTRSRKKK